MLWWASFSINIDFLLDNAETIFHAIVAVAVTIVGLQIGFIILQMIYNAILRGLGK